MSETTETRWFKIVAFVGTGFFAGLFLANIVYYNRIRNGGSVSKNEALSMLWLNAILFAIALALFIWCLVRLLTTQEVRSGVAEGAVNYLQGTNGGFNAPAGTVATTNTVQVTRLGTQGKSLAELSGAR